jgi:hypothetical protein
MIVELRRRHIAEAMIAYLSKKRKDFQDSESSKERVKQQAAVEQLLQKFSLSRG